VVLSVLFLTREVPLVREVLSVSGTRTFQASQTLSCWSQLLKSEFEGSNSWGILTGPGAKLGSHPAKCPDESGGVCRVNCPAKRQSGTRADTSGLGSGLFCKQGVRGSSPLSSTQT
jgi:hypothetical protein